MKPAAEFDIVVYGATGFTGRLVAEHLQKRFGGNGEVKWAMAGRDARKLAEVRDIIGAPQSTPLVVADAFDGQVLREMTKRTKAVVTTAGPYQLYGSELVAACAATGTDYLDLSGETHWMRTMIDQHEAEAKRTGARILHSCGFDSIPFELGVYFVQELAKKKFGHTVPRVKSRVRELRGALSGGTFASGQATREAAKLDPGIVRLLLDPFTLTPGFRGADQPRGDKVEHDEDAGAQVSPFFMSAINSKNVHRSNLLQGHAYGTDFAYDEMAVVGAGGAAEFVLPDAASAPKPGEGPSKQDREAGYYDILVVGIDKSGGRVRAGVHGKKDPGYGSTSMIMAETAVCLLKHGANVSGGVWVPAAALGMALVNQLQAHAGLSLREE
jgi:short subunit dehydrogenase-like uncharacterized protein